MYVRYHSWLESDSHLMLKLISNLLSLSVQCQENNAFTSKTPKSDNGKVPRASIAVKKMDLCGE